MSAIGTVTTGEIDNNVQLTFSHNSNGPVLIVTCAMANGRVVATDPWATYGGDALTLIAYTQSPATGIGIYMFGKFGAKQGANNVVINIDAPYNNTTMQATARSILGCNGWRTATVGGSSSTNAPSVAVTSVAGDLVVDGLMNGYNSSATPATSTVGADQTQQSNHSVVSAGNEARESTSSEVATGTSTTMSWSLSANQNTAHIGVALTSAPAGDQVIWIWSKLLDDLRKGLVAPWELRRRYRKVWAI